MGFDGVLPPSTMAGFAQYSQQPTRFAEAGGNSRAHSHFASAPSPLVAAYTTHKNPLATTYTTLPLTQTTPTQVPLVLGVFQHAPTGVPAVMNVSQPQVVSIGIRFRFTSNSLLLFNNKSLLLRPQCPKRRLNRLFNHLWKRGSTHTNSNPSGSGFYLDLW